MPDVSIRPLTPEDAPELLDVRVRNKALFAPYEPTRKPSWFTLDGQIDDIEGAADTAAAGRRYLFGIFVEGHGLSGTISIGSVERGAWLNCNMGYAVDMRVTGRGVATEAVRLATRYAFDELGLHRAQIA